MLQINLACRNALSKREENVLEDHSEQESLQTTKPSGTVIQSYIMCIAASNTERSFD
jgi:hypothetical protein